MRRWPLAIVLVAALASVAPAAKLVDRVVAVVNDEIITESELDQMAAPYLRGDPESADGKKAWEEAKHKALDQMIEMRLVLDQAKELKLSVTTEEVERAIEEVKRQNKIEDDNAFAEALKSQGFSMEAYRKNLRKQILQLKVLNTAVRARVNVSDDEVRAFYQQNERQMAGEKTAHLRQILVAVAQDAPVAEVEAKRKTATKLLEQARAGRSFVELAKASSDDDLTKAEGGDLGWLGHGVLVEPLEEVVAGMDPGDLRGPIRTSRGFHLLQLVERKAGDLKPFDEVKEQLRRQLYEQQVDKATQSWIRELRKKAHVDVRL
jgi:parvulin-like peptidyl-prolyl isomerase